jgi:hypothetical protein
LVGFVLANTIVNSLGIKMTAAFTWLMLVGECEASLSLRM